MKALRKDPRYKNAMIYVHIEANLSYLTANKTKDMVDKSEFYPVYCTQFNPSKDATTGVWSGEVEKAMYVQAMQYALSDGSLEYAADFITNDETIKGEAKNQLESYRRDVKLLPNGKQSVSYSGKGSNKKDDVCIVMQMLLYWGRYTRDTHEYIQAAQTNGWRS